MYFFVKNSKSAFTQSLFMHPECPSQSIIAHNFQHAHRISKSEYRPHGNPSILLAFWLTPCSRALLQKLIGPQLVKWNPYIHYHIHKCPLLLPLLSQINPGHVPSQSHFSKTHIISPSMPRSSKWPLSIVLPHQNPVSTSLSHMCLMPHPSHSSSYDCLDNVWLGVHIKLLIMQFSPPHCYLIPLPPKYLPQHCCLPLSNK